MRNSKPTPNISKAKEAILYILAKKPNITEEELKNTLYFIDFNHYEKYEEHSLGLTYIK